MALLKAHVSQKRRDEFGRVARRNRRTIAEELRIAIDRHLHEAHSEKGERQ